MISKPVKTIISRINDKKDNSIKILHSIECSPHSSDYLKNTRNVQSQRIIDGTNKLITIINEYKNFLTDIMKYSVKDDNFKKILSLLL